MNLAKLRSNIGKTVRLLPRPKAGEAFISEARNHWLLLSEEDKGIGLLNMVTRHEFLLPFDSIREYREPQTLILRAQIVLTDHGLAGLSPFADAPNDELVRLSGGVFEGPLAIGLSASDYSKELELSAISVEGLPSRKAADKIQSVLASKTQLRSAGIGDHVLSLASFPNPFSGTPYEARSIESLQENLANVTRTYRADDAFELFEVRAHKVNLYLLNEGSEYIEDASVQLRIERCLGLILAEKIHVKPPDDNVFLNIPTHFAARLPQRYPQVTESAEGYSVFEELGNIRHGLPTCAFEEPLRIVLAEQAKGQTIRIQCSIHGRNLASPRTEELSIKVL